SFAIAISRLKSIRPSRWWPSDCRAVVVGVALSCALLLLPGLAKAQAPELVTPLPSNQLTDATPAQTAAINRLRPRPTTQSLSLVTGHVDALRGESAQLSVPNIPSLTLSKRREDVRSPTDFTWHGTLSGLPGQATLVVHDNNITGSIQD